MFFEDSQQATPVPLRPRNEWRTPFPRWKEPHLLAHESIGDCYAIVIESILTQQTPFPGDDLFDSSELSPELHFHVHGNVHTRDYVIQD